MLLDEQNNPYYCGVLELNGHANTNQFNFAYFYYEPWAIIEWYYNVNLPLGISKVGFRIENIIQWFLSLHQSARVSTYQFQRRLGWHNVWLYLFDIHDLITAFHWSILPIGSCNKTNTTWFYRGNMAPYFPSVLYETIIPHSGNIVWHVSPLTMQYFCIIFASRPTGNPFRELIYNDELHLVWSVSIIRIRRVRRAYKLNLSLHITCSNRIKSQIINYLTWKKVTGTWWIRNTLDQSAFYL